MIGTLNIPSVLNHHPGLTQMNGHYDYLSKCPHSGLLLKTGICSRDDETYERVSYAAKRAFSDAFGFPTPAPNNCFFIFVERLATDATRRQRSTSAHEGILAGIALTRFADIPAGQSFPEKCISERLFSNLADFSGNSVQRDKCAYLGSLFVTPCDEDKTLLFVRLLQELLTFGRRLGLDYALCLAHKIVLKKLDKIHLPYLKLGQIDHANGDFSRFNLPEIYKQEWDRWLRLRPELILIGRSDAENKLGRLFAMLARMAA